MPFFRAFKWLEPYVEIGRLGIFTLFLGIALWHFRAIRMRASDGAILRRAKRLIAFVVAMSLLAGFTQVEAWPFTNWSLVHSYRSTSMTSWEIEGLDASGHGAEVDPRVLQPLQPEEFGAWMLPRITQLAPADRDAVLRFVLDRANAERARFLAGAFPRNDYILGPLSAPAHFAMRRVWRTAADVPPAPYVTIRIWRLSWDTEVRDKNPNAFTRTLLAEYTPR